MKFSKSFKMRASICETDKLVDLAKFIFDIRKNDRVHFNEPDIRIEKINDDVVSCKNIVELEKTLQRSLTSIRGINFSYWGKSKKIEIRIHEWSKNIEVNISSEKEGDILRNEIFVRDTFVEKSWNSYSMFVFFLLYFVLTISILVIFAFKQKIAAEIIQLSLFPLFIPSYWFAEKFSSFYPTLILVHNRSQSGRILRKDILFLLSALLVPFLLNRV